jgi:hypothetical protein
MPFLNHWMECLLRGPGDQIEFGWEGGPFTHIQIRVFSGWSPLVGYLNIIVEASNGSVFWTLPADLDPSLSHSVYVESAQGGVPSEQCWDYATLDVE